MKCGRGNENNETAEFVIFETLNETVVSTHRTPCLQTPLIRQSHSNMADTNRAVICSCHGNVHIMRGSICVRQENKQSDTSLRCALCFTLIGSREDVGHFMCMGSHFPPQSLHFVSDLLHITNLGLHFFILLYPVIENYIVANYGNLQTSSNIQMIAT